MAIDDNTIYGLYGSQIKDLPEKINAVKGLAKVLTTDDYNWPTGNPDGVALWLMEPGIYIRTDTSVQVYYSSIHKPQRAQIAIVGSQDTQGNVPVTLIANASYMNANGITTYFISSSGAVVEYKRHLIEADVIDNLTSTSASSPLSANQGKVLKDLIDGNVGKAKVLTTADYNWPTNNPDGVALWNLPSGLYQGPEGSTVKVYYRNGGSATIGQNNPELELVLKNIDGSQKGMVVQLKDYTSKMYYGVDDSGWSTANLFTIVTDNLTSTSSSNALSANQGRVLKNMIDAITGFSYEVVQTLPATGENGKIYLLPIDESGGPADNIYEEYIWVNNAWEMIGTTEMDLSDYVTNTDLATTLADYALASTVPSVVQSTGTSTTSVMSQNATTSMIYADPSNLVNGGIKIGASASASNSRPTAIGSWASATGGFSIALGANAIATQQGQFDVSTGDNTTAGYNNSQYRLLTGLYDPQSAHDAATKGYVDTEIAGISIPDTFTTNEWNALWA